MSVNEFEQLLNRYHEGACTPAEKVLVEEWFIEIGKSNSSSWKNFSADDKQKIIDHLFVKIGSSLGMQPLTEERSTKSGGLNWRLIIGIAASICLASVAYLFILRPSREQGSPESWRKIVSQPGHQKTLHLPDGTTIWLQGGSELMYPASYGEHERLVQLEGEAFFEVKGLADRPFVVKSGNLETKVLGTSFNIEAYGDLMRYVVSLVTGKVSVQLHSNDDDNQTALTLSPNEELVYHVETGKLAKSAKRALLHADGFKSGNMEFEQADLHEVLFTLGKAYGLDIRYDMAQAKARKMTGNFSLKQPIDEVLKSIAAITGGSYTRKGRKIDFSF
ncbi:FecR family protein [bacterium A37T11]|nr:FecR family protein [bacterium A37T11]